MDTEASDLRDATRELAAREPIFHRAEFGTRREDFAAMITADYWETGASGAVYSRDFVLDTLERRHREAIVERLEVAEFRCQHLAADHYLVTYLLDQAGRLSRRATIWHRSEAGWQALYHQGTLVAG
ncbi:MAG: DUF4440 domain-containing protein [Xanthomonadales bacterium]|nr:DUF4440 domain-containing protein [Xanthomonadales bacterium]